MYQLNNSKQAVVAHFAEKEKKIDEKKIDLLFPENIKSINPVASMSSKTANNSHKIDLKIQEEVKSILPPVTDMNTEQHKFAMMIQFANKLKELEWTDAEELTLPEKYTDTMVHLALEKADAEQDEKNFYAILNGDTEYRTLMLKRHIEKTLGVFTWNFTA